MLSNNFIGYPIANDPLYSKTEIWGEQCGKGGVNKEGMDKVIENMMAMGFPNLDSLEAKQSKSEEQESTQNPPSDATNPESQPSEPNQEKEKPSWYVENCDDCVHPKSDPKPHQMRIWLHAYSYASNNNADPSTEEQPPTEHEKEGESTSKEEKTNEQKNYNSHVTILEDAWSFKTSLPDWAKEDFVEE